MDKYVGVLIFVGFLLFAIISIILSIRQTKKEWNKTENKKDELVNNNTFLTEKREKYEKIMDDNVASLDDERNIVRRKMLFYGILVLAVMVLSFIFRKPILFALIPITIIVPGIIFSKQTESFFKKSAQMFNQTAATILKEYDSNLDYYPTKGYTHEEYNSLYFAEPCDLYNSSDMIINSQSGFCYADVYIQTIDSDDEGTSYNVEFDGSLARMSISNIGCTVILGGLAESSFKKSDTFKMIKFENDEFNKMFTCFSNNELVAYKILTPDVMEQFVNIRNNSIGDIDVRIINDKLYIRFENTNGFDGTEGSKEELFKSVAVLDHIIKTMNKVKTLIERKI